MPTLVARWTEAVRCSGWWMGLDGRSLSESAEEEEEEEDEDEEDEEEREEERSRSKEEGSACWE